MISTAVQSEVQVKIGMSMSFMPGARILIMVTKKLTPVNSVPKPETCSAQM